MSAKCRIADERLLPETVEAVRLLERVVSVRSKLPDGKRRNLAYRLRQVAKMLDTAPKPPAPPPPPKPEPTDSDKAHAKALLQQLKAVLSGEVEV